MKKSIHSPQAAAVRATLVAMRKKAGLTQRQLAAKLETVRSFVARIELGERRVDLPEFYQICKACGHDPVKMAAKLMREFNAVARKK